VSESGKDKDGADGENKKSCWGQQQQQQQAGHPSPPSPPTAHNTIGSFSSSSSTVTPNWDPAVTPLSLQCYTPQNLFIYLNTFDCAGLLGVCVFVGLWLPSAPQQQLL
jgi:hypothetical protein